MFTTAQANATTDTPARSTHATRRLIAAGIAAVAAGVLGLAAWMQPSAAGHGTHTQIGLPACGFEMSTGLPCATCGMTTAFAHAADGRFLASLLTQPAGFVLVVLTALACVVGVLIAATGADPRPLKPLASGKVLLGFGGLVLAAWCYKLLVTLGGLA